MTVDILILGATGFTGKLCTRYLYAHPDCGSRFTFSIGARSKSKLEALVSELELDDSVGITLVDVTKPEQVDKAVQTAKVVINTVGPYFRWGTVVVAACVRHGVHYVDLAGEPYWTQSIIRAFDYAATKTHAIIVPSSGCDSIPSDVVTFLANQKLKSISVDSSIDSSTSAWRMKGGVSGGTIGTALSTLDGEVGKHELEEGMKDYSLSPVEGLPSSKLRLIYTLPFLIPTIHGAFFPMMPVNKTVVQRTWGLHQLEATKQAISVVSGKSAKTEAVQRLTYGQQFRYDEFLSMPNWGVAFVVSSVLVLGAAALAYIPPFRWLFKKLVPQPGSGPSESVMEKGHFSVTNVTTSVPTPSAPSIHIKTVMKGKGDPGYLGTAVMISESALGLLLDHDKLPDLGRRGGVLTPMSALGDVLIDRLSGTGRFEFSSEVIANGRVETRKTK